MAEQSFAGAQLNAYGSVQQLVIDADKIYADGARIARVPILAPGRGDITKPEFDTFIEEQIVRFIALAGGTSCKIIPAWFDPRGGPAKMFRTASLRAEFVETWTTFATALKDIQNIFVFDLLNEPPRDYSDEWQSLAQEIVSVIRKTITTTKRIAVAAPTSRPEGIQWLRPLPFNGIWYEVHCYRPEPVTFQGITTNYPKGRAYTAADADTLARAFNVVKDWRERYKQKVYVGEFGISRFAAENDRALYIHDVVQHIKELDAHWTFHAFHEATVWDPRLGKVPSDPEQYLDSRPAYQALKLHWANP